MNRTRKHTLLALVLLTAGALSAASPSFSIKLNGGLGAYNLLNNPTVSTTPGFADNSNIDVDFGVKGSFGKEGTYNKVSYNSGARIDLDALYRNPQKGNSYVSPDSSYSNNFAKIQKMIDWYEANKHRYNLPDNPFSTGKWPTTSYGEGSYSHPFINGTTVVNENDVHWTSTTWAAADALYHDINSHIGDALESLYKDKGIPVGRSIKQDEFSRYNSERKEYALLKMEALNSFKALTGDRISYPAASAYVQFTNVANAMDIRADIGNARLSAGKLLHSPRAGQNAYGSSIKLGLTRDFINGLDAGLTIGAAGGIAQRPEIWDTQVLDYDPGKYAELALKLNADYTYQLKDLKLDVTAGLDFILPDLLVSPANHAAAFRVGAHWNDFREYVDSNGFYLVDPTTLKNLIEISDAFEVVYVNTADRYDRWDKLDASWGLKNELYVSAYGAELRFDTSYKAPKFNNKYNNQIEDRFSATSAAMDFRNANLKSSALIELDLAFNTFRALNKEILTVNAGLDAMLYDGQKAGLGFNTGIALNFVDFIKQDLILKADMSYYKNDLEKDFYDYKKLPEKAFMDYTTISAGIEYRPLRNYVIGLNFVSAPSTSRRNSTRIMSVEATATISY